MKLKDLSGKESEFHTLIPVYNTKSEEVEEIWVKVIMLHDEARGFPHIKTVESKAKDLIEFIVGDEGKDIRTALIEDMYELLNS